MDLLGVGESLPIVELPGSPREQGRAHGEALRGEIHANVALYTRRLRHDAGLSAEEVATRTHAYLEVFTRLDSGYREAMDGIAEASGCRIDEIAMLNARYELLYSAWSAAGTAAPADAGECTGFGATRAATADGHVWIGQNWDWFPGVRGALLDVAAADGLRVLAFTEAGVVGGKIGLNSAGLGLCVNGLGSDADDWAAYGVPFHLRTWRILHSPSVETALAHATGDGLACSANFLIGSAADGGVVVDVEASPRGSNELSPSDGVLVHANHFVHPERLGITETFRVWPSSTYHRAARMGKSLAERRTAGPLTPDDFAAAMRDHDGDPAGVCRHPDEALPVDERSETALSVMIDLDARELRYTVGPPCQAEYRRVTFPG